MVFKTEGALGWVSFYTDFTKAIPNGYEKIAIFSVFVDQQKVTPSISWCRNVKCEYNRL